MEFSLTMTFMSTTNTKVSITVNDVKDNLSKSEIEALMDILIQKNVFSTKSGDLATKYGAAVTQKQVTKYELAK